MLDGLDEVVNALSGVMISLRPVSENVIVQVAVSGILLHEYGMVCIIEHLIKSGNMWVPLVSE